MALDLYGDQNFLELAFEFPLRRQEEHFAELHGERASPLRPAPLGQVADGGAAHARHIHAPVVLEVAIFDGEHSVLENLWNLVVGDDDAMFERKAADESPVVGVEFGHHVGPVVHELADLGQIRGMHKHQAARHARGDGEQHQNAVSDPAPAAPPSGGHNRRGRSFRFTLRLDGRFANAGGPILRPGNQRRLRPGFCSSQSCWRGSRISNGRCRWPVVIDDIADRVPIRGFFRRRFRCNPGCGAPLPPGSRIIGRHGVNEGVPLGDGSTLGARRRLKRCVFKRMICYFARLASLRFLREFGRSRGCWRGRFSGRLNVRRRQRFALFLGMRS